jgi:pyruvate dehydrogenase E2 component (dihydrolipoamide acetyltransferase)
MATEFVLPNLGENVEKADVSRVLVSVGDLITKDQPAFELETDKATVEVPSSVAGKVIEIRVKPGDKAKVGQVLLTVEEAATSASDSSAASASASKPEAAESATATATATAPAPAPASAEAGAASDKPAEASADAAAESHEPTPAASSAGAPKPAAKPAPVVDIAKARAEQAEAAAPRTDAPAAGAATIPAAPSVRRFARELGVDLSGVTGTGPGGRIGPDDVKTHVKALINGGGAGAPAAAFRAAPLPDFSKWGEVEARPMSNIRRKTAEHLTVAWQAPHVTQHDKADITALEEFRKAYGARVEKGGGKLTVTAVTIKILAAAIRKYPQFASSVDMANQALIFKKYVHIGVAVDTPNGLLVPVIRNVDQKTITEIAADLATLSQKARDKKLSLDDMSGGVLSVTNLGGIGGTLFTPIVNQPEVAILGMSRAATEPVWQNGAFVPRQMLPLSLSYDHRVIDGADAARFLRFVVDVLEHPLTMVL